VNTAVAQDRKTFWQDLHYYVPRWMAALVVFALIQELMFPSSGRGWNIPLLVVGLFEGAFGGLVFVCMQRWWNPKDSRVLRIRNYLAAGILVGAGSLFVMTAIYS
jgi:hypothetical protein